MDILLLHMILFPSSVHLLQVHCLLQELMFVDELGK